ncbi:3-methyl-2-oxobutanoate hydroxymethyltransferase [Bermanella marisrubri]|uniref:3-methyl-2-oxobutanoate hydroxymethyltransferase n=1 Tax=Bermanella marisrubri TaxID=207949 RepID=Q1N0Z2_9GAMM|nr:3-methyl-2-oxobutanoate hydroxymethyltransferase [Bermanella marisrubri]EAT11882.1 3-methyl-2-oxobutanoate hydroxymethyltransferase [Oceanobacter sp. RED65] [Bermanella marisrubri]QIZ83041.1 3-methyl-2-oxobutanoate hydroxymethyltransferase [Bermanella marisrubri]
MSKTTINTLHKIKQNQEKFSVVTAYDATFAGLASTSGIDVLLVGDSLGMVLQGKDSTVPVTMEEMCYHTQAVKNGNQGSLLMVDMPFMSYATPEQAMANAAELMQAGAEILKLEGGAWLVDTVEMLSERGVPVCAHLGLTPQYVHKFGGYKVQGKEQAAAEQMLADAKAMEAAGADLILLECVPSELAKTLTESINIPVIGIGAGSDTTGQVLVCYDMLGMNSGHVPKFVKNFLIDGRNIQQAFAAFDQEVKSGDFPGPEHGFKA